MSSAATRTPIGSCLSKSVRSRKWARSRCATNARAPSMPRPWTTAARTSGEAVFALTAVKRGGEVRRLQRQIGFVFGAALRLRLAVGVDPVDERAGERGWQPQQRQQALEVHELREVHLSALHQIIEIEQSLLVRDVTGEFAVFNRHRRQAQRPGFAEMIDAVGAAIVG